MKPIKSLLLLSLLIIPFISEAARVPRHKPIANTPQTAYIVQNGNIITARDFPTLPMEEHWHLACEAYERNDWGEGIKQFRIVSFNFDDNPYAHDAFFYLGVCYNNLSEYEQANEAFNKYLACQTNPRFFEEAIAYKFAIAEQFRSGARRRVFGYSRLPKWASGKGIALDIYDEVIVAIPNHDLSAQALFSKACLLWEQGCLREGIDTLQLLIRRFPKHELAPESYLLITKIYLDQSRIEFQNPDILAFAQINLRRFQEDFPKDTRIADAENDVSCIEEAYAKGFYKTGFFYERIGKPWASVLYYQKTILDFPNTYTAERSICRLSRLCPSALAEVEIARQKEKEEGSEFLEFTDDIDLSIFGEDA